MPQSHTPSASGHKGENQRSTTIWATEDADEGKKAREEQQLPAARNVNLVIVFSCSTGRGANIILRVGHFASLGEITRVFYEIGCSG